MIRLFLCRFLILKKIHKNIDFFIKRVIMNTRKKYVFLT